MIPSVLPHRYPGGFSPTKLVEDTVAALHVARGLLPGDGWLHRRDGWKLLPLRSRGGALDPDEGLHSGLPWRDTPMLGAAPTFALVIAEAQVRTGRKIASARLSCLAPGGRAPTHTDRSNPLRMHVPITTNDKAAVVLDEVEHHWQPGEMWIGDFSRTHRAFNGGASDRIHLLMIVEQ